MVTKIAKKMDDDVEPTLHQQAGRIALSVIHFIGVGAFLLVILLALAY